MTYGINIYNSSGEEVLSTSYPVMVANSTFSPPVHASGSGTFYEGSSWSSKTTIGSRTTKQWKGMSWSTSLSDDLEYWINTGGNQIGPNRYFIYGPPTNYKVYEPNTTFIPASGSLPTDYLANLDDRTSSFDLYDPTPLTGGHLAFPIPVGVALNTSRWRFNAPLYADIDSTGYLSSSSFADGYFIKPASYLTSSGGYGLECYDASGGLTYSSSANLAIFRGGFVDPTTGSNAYSYTWTIPSDVTHISCDRTFVVSDILTPNFPQGIVTVSIMFIYRVNSTTLKSVWYDSTFTIPNVLAITIPYFPDQRGNVQLFRIT